MRMNKTFAFAAVLVFASATAPSFAQSTETQGLERIQSGFVIAPDFKFSEMDGESANLLGGYAGWLTDRRLFIGGGAYWLTNGPAGSDLAYGGALVEWFAQRNDRFNLSFRGLAGLGTGTVAIDVDEFPEPVFPERGFGAHGARGANGGRDGRFPHPFPSSVRVDEAFFVAEPQANASYTFTSWMRLGVGAGYRRIAGASGLESRFRGPTASVSVQFGKFY
jgi:hypothetical protein